MDANILEYYIPVNIDSHLFCGSELLSNEGMQTGDEIRRENLERLINEYGSLVALSEVTGLVPAYLSHMRTGRSMIGRAIARKLEKTTSKPIGWLDNPKHEFSSPALYIARSLDDGTPTLEARQRLADYIVNQMPAILQLLGAPANIPQAAKQEKAQPEDTYYESSGMALRDKYMPERRHFVRDFNKKKA